MGIRTFGANPATPAIFYGLEAGFLEVDEHFDFFATVGVGVISFHANVPEGVKDGLVFTVEPDENHGVADPTG